jgi:predicted ester cyclase
VTSSFRANGYPDSHGKDFVAHAAEGRLATLAEDIAAGKEERKAMPDLTFRVDHAVAEKDLMSVSLTASGTNTQAGMGFPVTSKRTSIEGMTLFRFKAGEIAEESRIFDMLSVLTQAGLYTPSSMMSHNEEGKGTFAIRTEHTTNRWMAFSAAGIR